MAKKIFIISIEWDEQYENSITATQILHACLPCCNTGIVNEEGLSALESIEVNSYTPD